MADLIYSALCSLDGYIEDKSGKFDWAEPDEEVHRFVNNIERGAGTYLYGRRMYQTMANWETDPSFAASSPFMRDYAKIWQAADKIVFSRTLAAVSTARTRLERIFDAKAIRDLKASARRDILIGGPDLAAHAFKAGLVDQCHLLAASNPATRNDPAPPTRRTPPSPSRRRLGPHLRGTLRQGVCRFYGPEIHPPTNLGISKKARDAMLNYGTAAGAKITWDRLADFLVGA